MIKTRPASTAPPTISDEELKENWSRRPCCSMIHDLFLGQTTSTKKNDFYDNMVNT